ncbi:MAG: hypothetical protein J2P39_11440 [Candidatus Dormibacteraeota bacterium]|nr:hypothetical protein [Candidatus Dormibacteraeota bacterium]
MRLLAQCELDGRGNGGEGLGLVDRDGRRFLFIAHESAPRNLTVVDVSDPRRPEVVRTLDLPHQDVRSNSLSVSASGELLAVAYQVRRPGLQPAGVELFDISTPAEPRSVGFFDTSGPYSRGTHFVWLVGERAYIATGLPDFEPVNPLDDQIVVVLDVADPARPREAGRWWLPGTRRGDTEAAPVRHPVHDMGHRAHNVNVYPSRPDRAYVGYLDAGVVILDLEDPSKPRLVSRLDYHPPLPGFTHTVLPLLERGLLAVTDEAVIDDLGDHPKKLWVMDGSCETNVVPIATAPLPPVEEFRGRGGRFGAHNVHENDPTPTAWHSEDVLIGAFFGAGVRAYDIRDPFQPREIGHLMPPAPADAVAAGGPSAPWAQMNDVYVDERGLIYAIDRFAGGLYVIELTGT